METPNRIPAPAPELHIDWVSSEDWFLHASPELCMKRILAEGFDRIFQIFQRLHRRDQYDGTGIGLAVVRRIAEQAIHFRGHRLVP